MHDWSKATFRPSWSSVSSQECHISGLRVACSLLDIVDPRFFQWQHIDNPKKHYIFLMRSFIAFTTAWPGSMVPVRVTGYDNQTAFSSRPPAGCHHCEWGHGLFCLGVEENDALIADGSVPHGNWFTGDEAVYTIFMTMHPSNDDAYQLGFENKTYTQCYMIFDELGSSHQTWSTAGIQQFREHPTLLSQVEHFIHARANSRMYNPIVPGRCRVLDAPLTTRLDPTASLWPENAQKSTAKSRYL